MKPVMQAIGYGPVEGNAEDKALRYVELPAPVPSGTDILVRVSSVALNPVDAKIRARVAPAIGEQQILGWDAAGVVEAVGESVDTFKPGDQVWYAGAVNRPGCNSELHLVDSRIAALKPANLDFKAAAAMPLTSITAWELLFDRFGLNASSQGYLLVIGGAGGVGSMLIQLAKQLTQVTVIATASRPQSRDWVKTMGADLVIDHHQPLAAELNKLGVNDVPWIASLTHTDKHLASIADVIAPQGKLGVIDDPATLDIMPFKRKSVSVHWEFMFTRSLFATDDIAVQGDILKRVAELVDQGRLRTTMAEDLGSMSPQNLSRGHELIHTGSTLGKLVLGAIE